MAPVDEDPRDALDANAQKMVHVVRASTNEATKQMQQARAAINSGVLTQGPWKKSLELKAEALGDVESVALLAIAVGVRADTEQSLRDLIDRVRPMLASIRQMLETLGPQT
jgi:hypothetical protein